MSIHIKSEFIFKAKKKTISQLFFHILIKLFFGCKVIYKQKNKKKRQKPASLKADKQVNEDLFPLGDITAED